MASDIRHLGVRANGVELHVAEAGPEDGPLVLLLHGFPEHWRAWRAYIGPLTDAGFHVVAPDQRGYGLSGKPAGKAAYDLDILADDMAALADHFGASRFSIIGHDWGASVGWWLATRAPERVDRLVAMNAPHPAVWREGMENDPEQRRLSGYVRLFNLPWLPEFIARRKNFDAFVSGFRQSTRPEAFPPSELDLYREAWAQPGALTATFNWYRALLAKQMPPSAGMRVAPPVLLIWGENDAFGLRRLADQSLALCGDGRGLFLKDATHWSLHDEPEGCRAAILDFLRPTVQPSA